MTKLNKLQFIAEAALGHEGSLIKAKNYVLESKKLKTKFLKFHILIAEEIADIKYKHYKLYLYLIHLRILYYAVYKYQ